MYIKIDILSMNTINFYKVADKFGEFSNFYPAQIYLKEKKWPTVEHYFQAMKFEGTVYEEEIRNTVRAIDVAAQGRNRSLPLRADWEQVKNDIMLEALRAKFTQHKALQDILLSTGNALLVEHTANDAYWGDAGDGTGKNMLGILLMKVREELHSSKAQNNKG